jgi:hypothetical protein
MLPDRIEIRFTHLGLVPGEALSDVPLDQREAEPLPVGSAPLLSPLSIREVRSDALEAP